MGLKAFSIFDSKAAVFGRPFCLQTAAVALRIFTDMANSTEDPVGQHPEDYTLFELADWDEDSGLFVPHATPFSLAVGISLVQQPQVAHDVLPGYTVDEHMSPSGNGQGLVEDAEGRN